MESYKGELKMDRKSIRKGKAGENEVVKLLLKYGIQAERVPLSGALKSSKYAGDVVLALANDKRIEVKRRKTGLKTIQKWLNQDEHVNYIFFREDGNRENWIVIMRFSEFVELVQTGEGEDGYSQGR
jgi:Holliday junction resolvase